MCLAIPAQVVELQEQGMARVRVGESQTYLTASMLLLPEPPKVGDYVIVHAGFALHSLTPEQAQESPCSDPQRQQRAFPWESPFHHPAAGPGRSPARSRPPVPSPPSAAVSASFPCLRRGLWPTRKSPHPHVPGSGRVPGCVFRRKSASGRPFLLPFP